MRQVKKIKKPPRVPRRRPTKPEGFWGRSLRKPLVWLAGITAAALTAAITTIVTDTAKKVIGSDANTTTPSVYVSASASSSPKKPVAASDPVWIKPVAIERKVSGDYSWAIPNRIDFSKKDLKEITTQLFGEQSDTYMPKIGGVWTRGLSLKIVAEGRRESPVRILDMQVEKKCVPLQGTAFIALEQGGDPSIGIGFNLDMAKPSAQIVDEQLKEKDRWRGRYFDENSVSLKQGEQSVFQVAAVVSKYYCEFRLVLVVLDGDKTVRQVVDNNGSPFKVSGIGGDPYHDGSFAPLDRLYIADVLYGQQFFEVNPKTYDISMDPRKG
ncbi:hypothetical protein AB0H88_21460 [Nonomuraea sp. NPDC050680]|uniref:hypothetical protein n=1 Tax=Nonomuraea sp. NPDC050680 TaxID=3154630 RepID=UPI0033DC4A3A